MSFIEIEVKFRKKQRALFDSRIKEVQSSIPKPAKPKGGK